MRKFGAIGLLGASAGWEWIVIEDFIKGLPWWAQQGVPLTMLLIIAWMYRPEISEWWSRRELPSINLGGIPRYPAWMGWTGIVLLLGVALPLTYPGPREAVFSLPGHVMGAIFTDEPELVWTHPRLPTEEQIRVVAECKMHMHEAIPHSNIGAAIEKAQYFDACLQSRGFVQQSVDIDPE